VVKILYDAIQTNSETSSKYTSDRTCSCQQQSRFNHFDKIILPRAGHSLMYGHLHTNANSAAKLAVLNAQLGLWRKAAGSDSTSQQGLQDM
jgi:hypothetical protein